MKMLDNLGAGDEVVETLKGRGVGFKIGIVQLYVKAFLGKHLGQGRAWSTAVVEATASLVNFIEHWPKQFG